MSLPTRQIENIHLQRLYSSNDGTQLELIANSSESNTELGFIPHPILSIHANEEEILYMELFVEGVLFRIPVAEVERAIEYAKDFVHSESWFEAGNQLTCESGKEPYADWGFSTDL